MSGLKEIFHDYHLKNGDMNSDVDCVTDEIQEGRGDGSQWTPSMEVIQTLMSHFKQERDAEGAEAFVEGKERLSMNQKQMCLSIDGDVCSCW